MKKIVILLTIASFIATNSFAGCTCHKCKLAQEIDNFFSPLKPKQTTKANIEEIFSKKINFEHKNGSIELSLQLGKNITSFDGDMQEDQIIITMPDIGKKIIVSYDEKTNFLSVGTETKKEIEKKEKNKSYRRESSYGSMKQGMTIDADLDLEKATFAYEGDTLTISIPKKIAPPKKKKKIKVAIK